MKLTSVQEVTTYLEERINDDFHLRNITVEGVIVSCSKSSKGHVFFSLKDVYTEAKIECVFFSWKARLNKEELTIGKQVIVDGSVQFSSTYGTVRLIVDRVLKQRVSARQIALEQLRKKMEEQGYFDLERKKPLPPYPFSIGVVTSAHGAVIYDILNRVRSRNPYVGISFFSTPVQGDEAPEAIAAAIREANERCPDLDLLIVARGGGARDDLSAYDSEVVCKAAFESKIPIISAIGHESDTTLLDWVADMRAATPTHAAEMAVPTEEEIQERLITLGDRMKQGILNIEESQWQHLALVLFNPAWQIPYRLLTQYEKKLYILWNESKNHFFEKLRITENLIKETQRHFEKLSPKEILAKGYYRVEASGHNIRNLFEIKKDDHLVITDGHLRIHVVVKEISKDEAGKQ